MRIRIHNIVSNHYLNSVTGYLMASPTLNSIIHITHLNKEKVKGISNMKRKYRQVTVYDE